MAGFADSSFGTSSFGIGDTSAATAIAVVSPADGASGLNLNPDIVLAVTEADGAPALSLLSLTVADVLVFDGSSFAPGWSLASALPSEDGSTVLTFRKAANVGPNLPAEQTVACTASYRDVSVAWSFTTLGPFLVASVSSVGRGVLRVRFNRPPNDDSRLRTPSNYAISSRSGFGASAQVRQVEYPGGDFVDLHMYRWLTANGDYLLRVDEIVDQYGVEVTS